LLEQAINSNESFDLILEPESFGKVRVNVSVDSSQIDVKLTAENSSTLAILRSSESMLQTISEQNGLKLAEYNVELNNNAQNNEGSQGRKNEKDKNGNLNEGLEELENKQGSFVEDDDSHSLNLIA
jgi:flagellar hook-length control protein FliK